MIDIKEKIINVCREYNLTSEEQIQVANILYTRYKDITNGSIELENMFIKYMNDTDIPLWMILDKLEKYKNEELK